MITVRLRYFASLREALGPADTLSVADGATLGSVRDQLIARGGRHAEVLARTRALRGAINQVLSDETAAVADGAEVAFFPPVTGG
jgi:molybdopterin synthase sulfur carrier subunit